MFYIAFTEEQKLRAASVDMEELLRSRGEGLIRSGRDKRLKSDHSVTIQGNEWYDHAAGKGGGPISFAQTFSISPQSSNNFAEVNFSIR